MTCEESKRQLVNIRPVLTHDMLVLQSSPANRYWRERILNWNFKKRSTLKENHRLQVYILICLLAKGRCFFWGEKTCNEKAVTFMCHSYEGKANYTEDKSTVNISLGSVHVSKLSRDHCPHTRVVESKGRLLSRVWIYKQQQREVRRVWKYGQ